MKVLLVSQSDIYGGAAIAAYRLHRGLTKLGVDSEMAVMDKYSEDFRIMCIQSRFGKLADKIRIRIVPKIVKLQKTANYNPHSINWFPNDIVEKINQFKVDIINLHWIGQEMIKIEDLKKIGRPIVWTLHDMWPFSGAEHYNIDEEPKRYIRGYDLEKRSPRDSGLDIDRWVWRRKRKNWKNINFTIVCPSRWLAEEARKSLLFRNERIEVIPNAIDVSKIRPIERKIARGLLSLPEDKKLVLFGAMDATSDPRKGFKLLESALNRIAEQGLGENINLMIFGSSEPEKAADFGINAQYLGKVGNDIVLMLSYSAADVFVIPSVMENLPNTIMEAMACGLPAVGFDVGGIPEMIDDGRTGFLTRAYDTEEMSNNIMRVVENEEGRKKMGENARKQAEKEYSDLVIAKKYLKLYEEVVRTRGTDGGGLW